MLVELSHGSPLESLDEYMSLQSDNDRSTKLTDHAILYEVAKSESTLDTVSSNEPQYYDAAFSCFWPRHLVLATVRNRCYEDVIQDMYDQIVPPLLKLNQNWRWQ